MVVFSRPTEVLAVDNAKYIKECTELYLANKGIEKLRGFEPFVNLEVLWLNGNKLKKINNLDDNFRLRALHAHDNQICTLRGSIHCFKFLEILDMSNNQLRNLEKQLVALKKLQFLKQLNLSGNPCVEEPDYRLIMIYHMPQLNVLDQHVITDQERRKAAAAVGKDVQTLTVAFGQRAPPKSPLDRVPERSVLEQSLIKEASIIRDTRAAQACDSELQMFKHNPYPDIMKGNTLPPNAGTRRAMEATRDRQYDASSQPKQYRGGLAKGSRFLGDGGLRLRLGDMDDDHHTAWEDQQEDQQEYGQPADKHFTAFAPPDTWNDTMTEIGTCRSKWKKPEPELVSPHVPNDVFVLYSCRPGSCELLSSCRPSTYISSMGSIKFENDKYQEFLKQRICGREKWSMDLKTVKI